MFFLCYFANHNEFLRDSSQNEPVPPNICNDIVSESGLTRRTSRLENFFKETPRIPSNKKKNTSWQFWRFVACVE